MNWFRKKEAAPLQTGLFLRGVEVIIDPPDAESGKHLPADFAALGQAGFDRVVREQFIPWLKGEQFADRDDDRIFDGLKLYEVVYHYGRIIAQYSPTGEDGWFGQFECDFESGSDYTADMLEAVAMQVTVFNGKIVKVDGFDV